MGVPRDTQKYRKCKKELSLDNYTSRTQRKEVQSETRGLEVEGVKIPGTIRIMEHISFGNK